MYREDTVTKTNDGGLNSMKKERKVVWVFLSTDPIRCPVRLVDKYISLCPQVLKSGKKANFYLRPLEKINPAQWYSEMVVGKSTLSKVVSKLLKNANLDGYFTNHSLRRTSATRLFQAGIDTKIVKELTGHVSDALNKYQITSNAQKEQVSMILNGSKSSQNDHKTAKDKKVEQPIVPNLEVSVTDKNASSKGSIDYNCSCKHKAFKLNEGTELAAMINDIVTKRKGGRAKIKLEIELSD